MRTVLHTLLVCSAFLAAPATAQVVNGGFENWTDLGTYEDPDGWITQNEVSTPFGAVLCEKGTPGNPGSYYLKLTTKNVPIIGPMPAVLTSGTSDGANSTWGFPVNSRPAALTGNWQHLQAVNDSGFITVAFTKWNTGTQSADGLGGGLLQIGGTVSSWQPFSIPITWGSTETPDTAIIFMYSSTSPTPNVGNYLYVDNLAFSNVAGTDEVTSMPALAIQPSPAETTLRLRTAQAMAQVTVWDARGNLVLSERLASATHTMDVRALPSGIYVVEVRMMDATLARERFVKL